MTEFETFMKKKPRSFMGKNVKYFVKYVDRFNMFLNTYIFIVYISSFINSEVFSVFDNISILYNYRSCNVRQ
jgi:hypothetical protein